MMIKENIKKIYKNSLKSFIIIEKHIKKIINQLKNSQKILHRRRNMAMYGKLGKGKAKAKSGIKARMGKAAPKKGKLGMKSQKEKKSKTSKYAYQKLQKRIR